MTKKLDEMNNRIYVNINGMEFECKRQRCYTVIKNADESEFRICITPMEAIEMGERLMENTIEPTDKPQ